MLAVGECLQAVCQKSCVKVYKIFGDFLLQLLLLIHDVQPSRSKISLNVLNRLLTTAIYFLSIS